MDGDPVPNTSCIALSDGSGLPNIDANSELTAKPPKQALVELLDVLEGHVENLRREAIKLEEDRDSLVSSLDSVKHAEILAELAEHDREDVIHYVERIMNRCHTVELKIHTQRDKPQEDALHQINYLIDCLVIGMKNDPDVTHSKCVAYMNSCSSNVVQGITDKNFESALLGCTVDDQKRVKKRLQGLFSYMNILTVTSDND